MAPIPVPADELTAVYEPIVGPIGPRLILIASGEVSTGIRGIHFERLPWAGGLRYQLVGYPRPAPIIRDVLPSRHYSVEDAFSMILPNRVTPSGTVIIVTENHPSGQVINIEGVRPLSDGSDNDADGGPQDILSAVVSGEQTSDDGNDVPTRGLGPVLPPVKVRALLDETFEITIPDQVVEDIPNIDVAYDPSFFRLVNAGHKHKDLFWEFEPIVTGYSNIVVYTSRDGQRGWNLKIFNVRSFLPVTAGLPDRNDENANSGIGLVEPFLAFLYTGIRIVQAQVPGAKLYQCSATSSTKEKVNDVADLNVLEVIFQLPNGETGILTSAGWGDWKPLKIIREQFFGCVAINWPIRMDAPEAQNLKNSEFPGSFYGFVLRHPLGPDRRGSQEPYYIFTKGHFTYVFVGINSHDVFQEIGNTAFRPNLHV